MKPVVHIDGSKSTILMNSSAAYTTIFELEYLNYRIYTGGIFVSTGFDCFLHVRVWDVGSELYDLSIRPVLFYRTSTFTSLW